MRSGRCSSALNLSPLPPIARDDLVIPDHVVHLPPWTKLGLAGASKQVAMLQQKRTPSLLVASLATGKSFVPVHTEAPQQEGQPVQVDSSSDEEKERGPAGAAVTSGGDPAGDERKPT